MQTLTTGEIAKHCGVNFRTVIRWIDKGHLKAHKLPGRGNNRVQVHDFLHFLQRHKMPIPQELSHFTQRVLVVDDDPLMAASIQRVLQRSRYEVKTVTDGFQAGAALVSFLPAVMTLDLQMPGLDGFALLDFVRSDENLQQLRILVVSAAAEEEMRRALNAGADALLEKPFEPQVLVTQVQQLSGATVERSSIQ